MRYRREIPGNRLKAEARIRMRSIRSDTDPGTWISVKSVASGKSSQNTSRHRSPPRIPVSQSWTSATRMPVPTAVPTTGPNHCERTTERLARQRDSPVAPLPARRLSA